MFSYIYAPTFRVIPRYRSTARSIAVPRYDPKSRGIYIEEAILCIPIYMPLLFGSYRGTAVLLEVSRYRGTF